ncbi:MAG: TrkA C-terminal domain-containing protein [Proteobacteria bacterium]|nr:TrkA C-terminal domain-containing protein [Pseudomonadota bacterium]
MPCPNLPTLVRCKNEAGLAVLEGSRASHIVVETYEESLSLIYYLLRILKIPEIKILNLIDDVRKKNYRILRKNFPGSFTEDFTEEGIPLKQLRPVNLMPEMYAVGKTIEKINHQLRNVEIIAVRRDKEYYTHFKRLFKLASGDIVILYGIAEDLEEAEEIFERG